MLRDAIMVLPCPFYRYDEATGGEEECEEDVTIAWYPGEEWSYWSPPWPATWEVVEGCQHGMQYPLEPSYEKRLQHAIESWLYEERQ